MTKLSVASYLNLASCQVSRPECGIQGGLFVQLGEAPLSARHMTQFAPNLAHAQPPSMEDRNLTSNLCQVLWVLFSSLGI